MMEELRKKLALRYGFRLMGGLALPYWVDPDGVLVSSRDFPDFPHSLDAIFKWLIPEVIKTHKISIDYKKERLVGGEVVELERWDIRIAGVGVFSCDSILILPITLCRAIEELIDLEEKR